VLNKKRWRAISRRASKWYWPSFPLT